jgi:DNA repair protein RadC
MAKKKKAKILELNSGEVNAPEKSLKKKSGAASNSRSTGKETPKKLMLKDMDKELRPREKFKKLGVSELEDYELLAIMLRTGIKGLSVLDFSRSILAEFKTLEDLYDATYGDLIKIKGIGPAKACELLSGFELAKKALKYRAKKEVERVKQKSVTSPDNIIPLLRSQITDYKKEHFFVINFDVRNRYLDIETISVGTLNTSLVHPRETFKGAIKRHAHSVMVAHNHPSGDLNPSQEDINITKRLKESGKILGIELLDHIIITEDSYFSFKSENYL